MPYSIPIDRTPPDPRISAPVHAYLTDGKVLMRVLESEWTGVLCENQSTGYLLEIDRVDLAQGWRRVRPAQDAWARF
jgi:hypothetical protein